MQGSEILERLKPGDLLLYSGHSVFSWLIKVKTWSDFSHAEVYVGTGITITSRDGLGVKYYPFEPKNLSCILRPKLPIDFSRADEWFSTIVGQKYDWWGLLRFFHFGKESKDKQFCFECCTRYYRAGGFDPFSERYDADLVSANSFYSSPNFELVWQNLKS